MEIRSGVLEPGGRNLPFPITLAIGFYNSMNYSTRRESNINFYRVMLCILSTSHGPVSVSLFITSRSSTKKAKRRIIKITPHDSPRTLVF